MIAYRYRYENTVKEDFSQIIVVESIVFALEKMLVILYFHTSTLPIPVYF